MAWDWRCSFSRVVRIAREGGKFLAAGRFHRLPARRSRPTVTGGRELLLP
jgi:hypothetical protein